MVTAQVQKSCLVVPCVMHLGIIRFSGHGNSIHNIILLKKENVIYSYFVPYFVCNRDSWPCVKLRQVSQSIFVKSKYLKN